MSVLQINPIPHKSLGLGGGKLPIRPIKENIGVGSYIGIFGSLPPLA